MGDDFWGDSGHDGGETLEGILVTVLTVGLIVLLLATVGLVIIAAYFLNLWI